MTEYLSFLALAALLAIAPGPDTLLTLRNTLVGGRGHGLWTALGVSVAGTVQGLLAVAGLGALIVNAEPVFHAIRWAGVLFLAYLGVMALREAFRLRHHFEAEVNAVTAETDARAQTERRPARRRRGWAGLRQGFLCNITNPKVLMFNLAVLPQFTGSGGTVPTLLLFALTLVAVGALVLAGVCFLAARAARLLARRRVRQGVEGSTGVVMLGFAGMLAAHG